MLLQKQNDFLKEKSGINGAQTSAETRDQTYAFSCSPFDMWVSSFFCGSPPAPFGNRSLPSWHPAAFFRKWRSPGPKHRGSEWLPSSSSSAGAFAYTPFGRSRPGCTCCLRQRLRIFTTTASCGSQVFLFFTSFPSSFAKIRFWKT